MLALSRSCSRSAEREVAGREFAGTSQTPSGQHAWLMRDYLSMVRKPLALSSIMERPMPGLTAYKAGSLVEAASVCLHDRGHRSGCHMDVRGDLQEDYVVGFGAPNKSLQATYKDMQEATEHGAEAVAM